MTVEILIGDCRRMLQTLPEGSVQMCVTSPPYFGLRDYGVEGQMGLEPTPDEFVAELVAVFREVRRVLADDGTLWLNLGDSYANDSKWGGATGGKAAKALHGQTGVGRRKLQTGLKSKDLIGIPWRVAFALQADGWYLRQDIIWAKPNPMPESVRDRCTKSHEYVFLLSKGPRYYFDNEAIKEPLAETSLSRLAQNVDAQVGTTRAYGKTNGNLKAQGNTETGLRNKRSVWTVTTKPFKGAHFATFPPDLIEPCILAGCAVGGTVLDPFFGAGTTGMVAQRLGRHAIGVELNAEYAAMARARIDAPEKTAKKTSRASQKAANDNDQKSLFDVA